MDYREVIGNIRSFTHNAESHKTLKNVEKGYVNLNKKTFLTDLKNSFFVRKVWIMGRL